MTDQPGRPLVGKLKTERAAVAEHIGKVVFGPEGRPRPIPRMAPPVPVEFVGRDEVLKGLIVTLRLGKGDAAELAPIGL